MPHYIISVKHQGTKDGYILDRVYPVKGDTLPVAARHAREELGFIGCLSLGFDKASDDERILEAIIEPYCFRIIPVYVQSGRATGSGPAPVFQLLPGGKK